MSTEFYRSQQRKARKIHECDLCRKTIEIGENYHYESGKFDGDIFENHLCDDCKQLQQAFFSIHRKDLDYGYTWDSVLDDISESVCYYCQERDASCTYGFNDVPKCEKARFEYVNIANK